MEAELKRGMLVRWPAGAGEPVGVILSRDAGQIVVLFDDDSQQVFSAHAAPLTRVALAGQVQRLSTEEVGFVASGPSSDPPMWDVAFPGANTFTTKTVPEGDLRPYRARGPVERMKLGQHSTPAKANLALVARYYDIEHRRNTLVSLGQASVDLKAYQVSVVHRVVTSYPHRFLLCDEVGLGKTIEAGMILKELRARGQASRALVIVPPNLVRQWQFELKSKFNETFAVLNTDTLRFLRNTGYEGNPFTYSDSILVSSWWISQDKQRAKDVAAVDWDIVIVDEAHHARGPRSGAGATAQYRLVRELAAAEQFGHRALLFLTATPMQLDVRELYSLVEMLDPALFPSAEDFEKHRRRLPGLNRLVDELNKHGFPPPHQDAEATIRQVAGWLDIEEDLARKRLTAGADEVAAVRDALSEQHLLSEVLIRNRKGIVAEFMPRRAHRWEVQLTDTERAALDAVGEYVSHGWDRAAASRNNSIGFVMTIFQKLMASSIRALRTSLEARRQRLTGEDAAEALSEEAGERRLEDDTETATLVRAAPGGSEEVAELRRLVAKLDAIKVDSKARTLLDQLNTVFSGAKSRDPHVCDTPESHNKVIIFTEFRETQQYLRDLLEEQGWDVHLFHGQMKPEAKDRSVEEFRDGIGPRILISTEAGGEGRNFQFCHMLVNYDLPWNPMRVEQRIGRVDRIGQDHVVHIFNLWVKGTIEERVLDVLERRINIFEETVGALDPILGDTERDLKRILKLRDREREVALADMETKVEQRVRDARAAEEKLRDFIMDTKSFSRDIAARITGQTSPISASDQERFVTSLLVDVNTYVAPREGNERQIVFHEPFVSDYKEFSKDGTKRRAAFRPEEVSDSEHVEYFAFGHPIVDALLRRVLDEAYEGNCGTRRILAGQGLEPNQGWLFSYVVSVAGLRDVEQLHPVFVADDGSVHLEFGKALVRRATVFAREQRIPQEEIPLQSLDTAVAAATATISRIAEVAEAEVIAASQQDADRERAKLEGYFDYRERAANEKIAATQATVERLESSPDPDHQRVVPVWRSNLDTAQRLRDELQQQRELRLAQIEQRLRPTADRTLTSLVRVEVLPSTTA